MEEQIYLLFDIGGTSVKYAAGDGAGRLWEPGSFKTPESGMEELLARIRVALRHKGTVKKQMSEFELDSLKIDFEKRKIFVHGQEIHLTPIEYKILLLLVQNPGRVFPADEIYERVWNERAINTDTVMVHIRNIREKIEVNPKEPKYVKVVWGVGYKIEKQA